LEYFDIQKTREGWFKKTHPSLADVILFAPICKKMKLKF